MSINIGIDDNHRKAVAEGLKSVLADTYALYLKTQNYHWNVTGPLFQAVHSMTEEQYTELAQAVDDIAERIRTLGFKAPGGFKALAALTDLSEGDETLKAEAMIEDLVKSHELVARNNRRLHETAAQAGDDSTVGLLDDRLAAHEKTAWMLRSLLDG
ncbi:MAG: Dps family protein [Rhodothalassiaceae bacterium]